MECRSSPESDVSKTRLGRSPHLTQAFSHSFWHTILCNKQTGRLRNFSLICFCTTENAFTLCAHFSQHFWLQDKCFGWLVQWIVSACLLWLAQRYSLIIPFNKSFSLFYLLKKGFPFFKKTPKHPEIKERKNCSWWCPFWSPWAFCY